MVYNDAYLERLKAGLLPRLADWGMNPHSQLTLLTFSENATFMAQDPVTGRRLILRVHRPGYSTPEEINAELAWLEAIKAQGSINVAAPVAMTHGGKIAELREGGTSTWVVAFEFVSGREPDKTMDLRHWYRLLGETAGHLHLHSQSWPRPVGFARKTWRYETIIGQHAFWGDWRALDQFSAEEISLLTQVEADIRNRLEVYGTSADRFGLVHCDMRLANLLVDGDKLTVIDFDDCGICWFGWDFATAVSFIEDDAHLNEYLSAWLTGYRTARHFSADDEAMLPVLIMLRRLQLTAWIASHAETPTAQQLIQDWGKNTADLARKYLHDPLIISSKETQDA